MIGQLNYNSLVELARALAQQSDVMPVMQRRPNPAVVPLGDLAPRGGYGGGGGSPPPVSQPSGYDPFKRIGPPGSMKYDPTPLDRLPPGRAGRPFYPPSPGWADEM
jgi:hypothetical protein